MTKKTAILILIVAVVVAGLFVSYLIFFPQTDSGKNSTGGQNNGTEFGFPTNNVPSNDAGVNNSSDNPDSTNVGVIIPRLRQISTAPVSGYTTLDIEIQTETGTSTATIYRYIDRATGNLYEATSTNLGLTRITNTTIPKIYSATFFDEGNGVVLQYLDNNENVETFVTKVVPPATTTTTTTDNTVGPEIFSSLVGTFLPTNVDSIAKSASDNRFFYTRAGKGYVFDANSPQRQTLIMDSQITEWLSSWTSESILLTTKPSAVSEGFVFTLNPTGGSLNKVADGGLGVLANRSPDSAKILLSKFDGTSLVAGVYNLEDDIVTILNIRTLADKCVWSKKDVDVLYCAVPDNLVAGQYPDIWYQGIVSFNDSLYKIDLGTNTLEKFNGLESVFDITQLQLSENEEYLTFINKKDLQLWSLDISN